MIPQLEARLVGTARPHPCRTLLDALAWHACRLHAPPRSWDMHLAPAGQRWPEVPCAMWATNLTWLRWMRQSCTMRHHFSNPSAAGEAGRQAAVTTCLLRLVLCVQADVYERLDALDSDTTEARAASILHGLGFDAHMQVCFDRGTACVHMLGTCLMPGISCIVSIWSPVLSGV